MFKERGWPRSQVFAIARCRSLLILAARALGLDCGPCPDSTTLESIAILFRHQHQIQFHLQLGLWRPRLAVAAQSAAQPRGGRAVRVSAKSCAILNLQGRSLFGALVEAWRGCSDLRILVTSADEQAKHYCPNSCEQNSRHPPRPYRRAARQSGHRELRRCVSRARRLRPIQDDGDERPRILRLYHRVAGEAREYQFVSNTSDGDTRRNCPSRSSLLVCSHRHS